MRYFSSKSFFVTGTFLLLLVALFAVSLVRTAYAGSEEPKSGERLLVIHDGSAKRGFLTQSETVREALDEAGIPLDANDLVEPRLDEELIASSYDINIYRARPITVVDGAVRKKIMSAYRTSSQIAKHADMELRSEDEAEMKLSVNSVDGVVTELVISRATPLTLVLYGKKTTVYTQSKTVAELLEEKGITIGEHDFLSVDESAPIAADMVVELWREGKQTITEEEDVQFETERIQDVDREVGYREIKTPGVLGKRTVTYEIEMKNGVEVSRQEIQSVIITEPKKQVEVVGAKPSFSGDFSAALAKLRSCEGGYNSWNPAGPYYGAYQFDQRTWATVADPAKYGNATPAEQDEAAHKLYLRRGWQPWPHCGASLPDIYR